MQVHQTKKSIKWECKLCGEKQSIKRHYGIGTGKDCRLHVQKLNTLKGEIDELKCSQMRRNVNSEDESDEEMKLHDLETQQTTPQAVFLKDSKWSNYVDEPEVIEKSNDPMCLGDADVVLEIPKTKRKQFQKYSMNYSQSKCFTKTTVSQNINGRYKTPELKEYTVRNSPESKAKLVSTVMSSNSPIKEKENFKLKVPVKKFVPPVLNKNSKWAQFADEDEQEVTLSPSISTSQNVLKFSLCDDSELDSVLDL